MLGLIIVCWFYLVYTILCRLINFKAIGKGTLSVRIIDNVIIVLMIIALFILYRFK